MQVPKFEKISHNEKYIYALILLIDQVVRPSGSTWLATLNIKFVTL